MSPSRKRIEHVLARDEVAAKQDLYELRDELAEVGMQPVDVLRPLPLRELVLRPREIQLEISVESILGRRHALALFGASGTTPGPRC